MRVAILNITGGGISGGYKRYLVNMLPLLSASKEIEAVLCAAPASLRVQDWCVKHPKVEYVDCRPFGIFNFGPDRGLDMALDRFRPDVIFVPIERRYDYKGVPQVAMLLNMAPMSDGSGYPVKERLRRAVQYRYARNAITRADHVIAVSGFVRDYITSRWSVPEKKTSVIYFGVTCGATETRPASIPEELEGRFLFTAGSIEPYRGLEDIILALAALKKKQRLFKMVICGAARPDLSSYAEGLMRLAEQSGVSGQISWIKGISDGELAWCYANCSAFIMSSKVEACPNTALESLCNGSLIISTENPPMPEMFAGSAVYYKAGHHAQLAARIEEADSCPDAERHVRSESARRRARTYSWDICAERTIEAFRKAVGSNV